MQHKGRVSSTAQGIGFLRALGWEDLIHDYVVCPACHGPGTQQGKTCSRCHGNGAVLAEQGERDWQIVSTDDLRIGDWTVLEDNLTREEAEGEKLTQWQKASPGRKVIARKRIPKEDKGNNG